MEYTARSYETEAAVNQGQTSPRPREVTHAESIMELRKQVAETNMRFAAVVEHFTRRIEALEYEMSNTVGVPLPSAPQDKPRF